MTRGYRAPLQYLAAAIVVSTFAAELLAQTTGQQQTQQQTQQQGRRGGGQGAAGGAGSAAGAGRAGGGGGGRANTPLPAGVKTLRGPRPVADDFSFDIAIGLERDAKLASALQEVSAERLRRIDSMLVSFGSRTTQSDTMSTTRGIGAARRWIHSELQSYSRDCGGCLKSNSSRR